MLTLFRRTASAIAFIAFLALTPSAQAAEGDVHLFTGNPSGASAERDKADNYLLRKRQYALAYNSSTGTANWASWQLSKAWLGKARRDNPFAPDTTLPAGFFRVRPRDYDRSGFDRGHLCPSADRSVSHQDQDATFLMSNMIPQSPDLNRHGWAKLEEYCRSQAREGDEDLYVVAGPSGKGGTGSAGPRISCTGRVDRSACPASAGR
jgi:endonuclease G, mitochondrial